MGSWGIGHWIVVLVIVLLVFGTKRLTGGARDIGDAVREFKKGVRGDEETQRLRDERRDETQRDRDSSNADADRDGR
ncbi:MAG: twin-arginine translocase TatA/TatE family subunit [Lysobacter sp.]|nr:MAG: twin-arginine translocase TatA/TatE family subunit [Lysobacter sp.]